MSSHKNPQHRPGPKANLTNALNEIDKLELPETEASKLKNLVRWMRSPAGRAKLKKILRQTKKACDLIAKARIIPRELLTTPFGPADGSGVWKH